MGAPSMNAENSPLNVPNLEIKVMTYNLCSCVGASDSRPEDIFKERDPAVIKRNLDAVVDLILEKDIDIAFLQEIDFGSQRLGYVDQAEYIKNELSNKSGLPYYSFGMPDVCRKGYLGPLSDLEVLKNKSEYVDALRYLSIGNATVSKFPINEEESIQQFYTDWKKMDSLREGPQKWWKKARRLRELTSRKDMRKSYLETPLDIGNGLTLNALNTHLDPWNKELRLHETRKLLNRIRKWETNSETSNPYWILGGDLNSVPPHATKKSGYDDCPYGENDNYEKDSSIPRFLKSKLTHLPPELIPNGVALPVEHHTYHSLNPGRTLDYLVTSPQNRFLDYKVVRNPIPGVDDYPSDHLPVIGRIKIPLGKQ